MSGGAAACWSPRPEGSALLPASGAQGALEKIVPSRPPDWQLLQTVCSQSSTTPFLSPGGKAQFPVLFPGWTADPAAGPAGEASPPLPPPPSAAGRTSLESLPGGAHAALTSRARKKQGGSSWGRGWRHQTCCGRFPCDLRLECYTFTLHPQVWDVTLWMAGGPRASLHSETLEGPCFMGCF